MLEDLVRKSRSYRRFVAAEAVPYATLLELVDLARLSPSAANLQGLKFLVADGQPLNDLIFPCLRFAGHLTGWAGPQAYERPAAYILVLGDTRIKQQFDLDAGIAAQSMMLGAAERGLGGCIMSAINREKLTDALNLPEHFEIVLALALGKPAEKVVLEELGEGQSIHYYRDAEYVHHVPKRKLEDLLVRPEI